MNRESHAKPERENINIRESVERMTNSELVHQLLIIFRRTFKNLFEKADENNTVYKIMNYIIKLDEIDDTEDYSEFESIIFDVSWSRSKDVHPNLAMTETVDIHNKKVIAMLLLYKLIKSMSKNINSISPKEIEYLTHINIMYDLYLSESSLSKEDVERLAKANQSYELFVIAEALLKTD